MSLRPVVALAIAASAVALTLPAAAAADDTAPALGATSSDLIVGTRAGAAPPTGDPIAPRVTVVDRADAHALQGTRFVEPNRTFKASGLPAVFNDALFSRQWALSTTDGLNAPGAWWRNQGAGAVIAIVDSGVDMSHPDLAGKLWTNPGDNVHGVDLVNGTDNPTDVYGHGTAMAGAAAAAANNGSGITGVAPQARIMPVKVLDDGGRGNTATVVAGIQWAVAHGANVINLSMNGPEQSQALDEALAAAKAAGVTVVTSAGNDGANRDQVPSYPASSPGHPVISVAAADQTRSLTGFSAHGGSVDLAAPGQDVLSTARGGGWAPSTGTSVATAQTSGAAALLKSAAPSATPDQIRAALMAGAARGTEPGTVASGNLDVTGAMNRLLPGSAPRVTLNAPPAIRSTTGRVALRWRAVGAVGTVARYDLTVGSRVMALRSSAGAQAASARRTVLLRPGRYRFRVNAYDASGALVATRAGRVQVVKKRAKKRPRHQRTHRTRRA